MATQPNQGAPVATYAAQTDTPLLDSIIEKKQEMAARYKPVMDIKESIDRYEQLRQYVDAAMVEGEDYGKVPGIQKPFLFQAGAEKLCVLFGYVPHYDTEVEIEDWAGVRFGEPLFYYRIRCTMQRDGKPVGEGIGSASSWESKHRYRWLAESDVPARYELEDLQVRDGSIREPAFAIEKAETSGKYGKPAEYWERWKNAIQSGEAYEVFIQKRGGGEMAGWEMASKVYRVPNPDFADVINTCQKIAIKRAKVAAAIAATGLSSLFTQDEDSGVFPDAQQAPHQDEKPKRETKPKSQPKQEAPNNDPEPLRDMLASLKSSRGKTMPAIMRDLENRIIMKNGDAGATAYNTATQTWRASNPKGKETDQSYIDLVRALYAVAVDLETPFVPDEAWTEGRE